MQIFMFPQNKKVMKTIHSFDKHLDLKIKFSYGKVCLKVLKICVFLALSIFVIFFVIQITFARIFFSNSFIMMVEMCTKKIQCNLPKGTWIF